PTRPARRAVAVFVVIGPGQGVTGVIPITDRPHIPSEIRQWWGDSRAHWEKDTLVVDVTNFSPKTDYHGSRENLHLVERWNRTGAASLEYVVTIDDPTVWTRHGRSHKCSPGRATRRTEFIPSRAVTRETMPSRGSCVERAWKSSP